MSTWTGEIGQRFEDDTSLDPRGFVILRGQIIDIYRSSEEREKEVFG